MAKDAKSFKCLYNHEMLIAFNSQTPCQTYREDVTSRQVEMFVRELADTQVDAFMCCPTAWRLPLYPSDVNPHWRDDAPLEVEPPPEADRKYYDNSYWRIHRYMLKGEDPLALTLKAARETDLGFFISYRMNDHHYLFMPDCPTHPRFWREHPELRIEPEKGNNFLDYMKLEVREWYKKVLFELVDNYDIDGLELDFMRTMTYFASEQIKDGMPVMTEFVRDIRSYLDEAGLKRGRHLQLCVRVERNLSLCEAAGLDVKEWDREGLIDMVNASPFFIHSPDVEIEGYKREVRGARVYGEMHFITQLGKTPNGYENNIHRYTTRTQYETCALSFFDRGADGLSLFNFAYTRDHHFNEPRRKEFPGWEPPFDVLKRICDVDYLRTRPKQYHKCALIPVDPNDDSGLPMRLDAGCIGATKLYVADFLDPQTPIRNAVLRLESDMPIVGLQINVKINGESLESCYGLGELFTPFAPEAIPHYENLLFYTVPLEALRHGWNELSILNPGTGAYNLGSLCVSGIELALYDD